MFDELMGRIAARTFARRSAIDALALGMPGQVAFHVVARYPGDVVLYLLPVWMTVRPMP